MSSSVKKLVSAAANGSVDALRSLQNHIPHMPDPRQLLPVYYRVLDDRPLADLLTRLLTCSSSDDDASFTLVFAPKLRQVISCLAGIRSIDARRALHREMSPGFWSRIWAWIEFSDTYQENLGLQGAELSELYDVFLSTIRIFSRNSATAVIVDRTPQLHVLVFRLWRRYLEDSHIVDEGMFSRFCQSLRDIPGIFSDQHFEEALEGSGGSRASLAALIVRHITCVVESNASWNATDSLLFIVPAVQEKCKDDTMFSVALVDHGIVKWLTAAICLMTSVPAYPVLEAGSGIPLSLKTEVADSCGDALLRYLDTLFRPDLWTECLRAGGFQLFLAPIRELRFLLALLGGLKWHLVYLSVLTELETIIVDCDIWEAARANPFRGTPLAEDWTAFWSVLEHRWALVKVYLSRVKPAPRACDNLACGVIFAKTNFSRCSGCSTLNYCSRGCQLWDWRHGGHRVACKDLLALRLARPAVVSRRNKAFLRALLHDEYLRRKPEILALETEFLRTTPRTDYFILFDYIVPPCRPCRLSVIPLAELDSRLADYGLRAARSRGRMRVHLMRVACGGGAELWIYPLRTDTRKECIRQTMDLHLDITEIHI
ncbi:hypothetical protein C8R47DRAFT_1211297 [Mycena vitilis]|nr:hypothetical protein C8R47DRAFT_1211297 [Mycena vitilis]